MNAREISSRRNYLFAMNLEEVTISSRVIFAVYFFRIMKEKREN